MPAASSAPSFFTVTIGDPRLLPKVEEQIQEQLQGEGGAALSWLKGADYVLSRGAQKDLRSRLTETQILNTLSAVRGVDVVRRLPAEHVMALYVARDDAADPTGHFEDRPPSAEEPWHFRKIRARRARTLMEAATEAVPIATVRLAQMDTGYTEHPVFGPFAGDGTHPTIRGDLGINYREPGSPPLDPYQEDYPGFPSHGTRILSVIAGNTEKLKGIAAGVTVVPYRITDIVVINFLGHEVPLAEALRHAIDIADCRVVNISLGDPCLPGRDNGAAIDHAYESGVIVVAAAGNVTSEVTYPGRHKRTITAGGSTRADRPWTGGSRGPRVDVSAPADEIFRANWAKADDGTFRAVYGEGSGTSYATAHISGIACLWLARWGDALNRYPEGWQRVEAFRHILRSTARTPAQWDTARFGTGIVDAASVLEAPLPPAEALKFEADKAADDA